MLQGGRKATADHVAQHVEDHDVGVFQHVVLLEQFHGLANDITAAASASRGAACLHAFHAVEAFKHEVLGAEFLGMKIDVFEDVDDRGDQRAGQRERAVMLRITADLQDALAEHR